MLRRIHHQGKQFISRGLKVSDSQPIVYIVTHMILRITSFFLFIILLSGCTEPPYNNLSNAQLQAMLAQGVQIYDIRRPDEWRQTGVVQDSKLLTFVDAGGRLMPEFLPRFSSEVKKDDPVILICRTGNRTSALASHLVEQMGYTQVYNVRNGITSWISDGLPVSRL